MNSRNWNQSPQQRIDARLRQARDNRQAAVNKRVRHLQEQLQEAPPHSQAIRGLRSEIEEFRGKMKVLYMSIFQGTKQLSIRKSDLIRQIKGNEGEDYLMV